MIPKKNYPTGNNPHTKDLSEKMDRIRDTQNYLEGCLKTIGQTMYQLMDRIGQLEYKLKDK